MTEFESVVGESVCFGAGRTADPSTARRDRPATLGMTKGGAALSSG
jgi:hypothetical protein